MTDARAATRVRRGARRLAARTDPLRRSSAESVGLAAGLSLTLCGFIFPVYLVIVQLAVIDAVCEWCIANDILVAVLALLAMRRAWSAAPAASS